jgi:hypothetical protein
MLKLTLILLFPVITFNSFCQAKINSDTSFKIADIHFGKTVFLNAAAKKVLDSVLSVMHNYSNLKLFIEGHSESCEFCHQVSWDRIYSVIKYLKEQKFDSAQVIFVYAKSGDKRTVSITATSEDGPSMVPAPIPCYSYHKLTPKRCTDLDGHQRPEL